ncbi:hypothetical protein ES702_07711 [subsurface metagenome]
MNDEIRKIIEDTSTTIVQVAYEWTQKKDSPDFFHRRYEIDRILQTFLKGYIEAIFNL